MVNFLIASLFFLVHIFCFRKGGFRFFLVTVSFFHWVAFYFFYIFSKGVVTDSLNYFNWAQSGVHFLGVGTPFVINVVRFLNCFGFSDYLSVSAFFAGLSLTGMLVASYAMYDTGIARGRGLLWLYAFFCFLPGLHFWTVTIGKDALCVLFIGLSIWSVSYNKTLLSLLFVLCIFFVRPQVGIVFAFSFIFVYRLIVLERAGRKTRVIFKVAFLPILFLLFLSAYFFVMHYIQKYSSDGFSSLAEFVDSRSDVYEGVGSGFDASKYSFFIRWVFFILGGSPFNVHGIFQALSLLEGVVIMTLFFYSVKIFIHHYRLKFFNLDVKYKYSLYMCCFLVVLLTISLGSLTSNFGLASRQRVMIYLPLFFSFIYLRYYILYYIDRSGRA